MRNFSREFPWQILVEYSVVYNYMILYVYWFWMHFRQLYMMYYIILYIEVLRSPPRSVHFEQWLAPAIMVSFRSQKITEQKHDIQRCTSQKRNETKVSFPWQRSQHRPALTMVAECFQEISASRSPFVARCTIQIARREAVKRSSRSLRNAMLTYMIHIYIYMFTSNLGLQQLWHMLIVHMLFFLHVPRFSRLLQTLGFQLVSSKVDKILERLGEEPSSWAQSSDPNSSD